MPTVLKIDGALYEVDDKTRTYRYYGRNQDWRKLGKEENIRNKGIRMAIQESFLMVGEEFSNTTNKCLTHILVRMIYVMMVAGQKNIIQNKVRAQRD